MTTYYRNELFSYSFLLVCAFVITIIIECLCAYILRFRSNRTFAVIAFTDCITNPLVNILFAGILRYLDSALSFLLGVAGLEIAVILAEKVIFERWIDFSSEEIALKKFSPKRKALLLSVIVNTVSCILGFFIRLWIEWALL